MKKYIKSNSDSPNYIGGKLYDLPDSYWDDEYEELHTERNEQQDKYIRDFAKYYIIYRPKSDHHKFELCVADSYPLYDITDAMAIKDGIDIIAYPDHIEIVGYYNSKRDIVCLYPVSDTMFDDLAGKVDNSDFDESTTLENELAQYAWGGASVEDILKSWR